MFISVINRKLRSFRLRVSKASGFELSCVLTEDVGTVGAVTGVWKKILFHSNFSVHTCVFLSQTAAFTIRLLDCLGCIPVLSAPLSIEDHHTHKSVLRTCAGTSCVGVNRS